MIRIQVILILALIPTAVLYFSAKASKLLDRLVVLLFVVVGTVMVAFPNSTTWVANRLGVGRGADLVFYLAMVTLGFLISLVFKKIRDLEANLTSIIRELAIERAEDNTLAAREQKPSAKATSHRGP